MRYLLDAHFCEKNGIECSCVTVLLHQRDRQRRLDEATVYQLDGARDPGLCALTSLKRCPHIPKTPCLCAVFQSEWSAGRAVPKPCILFFGGSRRSGWR